MAEYLVKSPDGKKTYRVTAPDTATEAEIDAQVRAAVGVGKNYPVKNASKPTTSKATSVLGDIVDNVIPNAADEIFAAGGAAKAALTGGDVGATFDAEQARFKQGQDEYDAENPTAAWGTTLGGTALSLAIPAGTVAQGASRGIKAAHAAGVGGAYGAASGAAQGDGLSERATNAITGLGIGATVAPLIGPLLGGANAAGRYLRANVKGVDGALNAIGNVPRAVYQRFGGTPAARPNRAAEQADRILSRRMSEGEIAMGPDRFGPAAPANPTNIANEVERRANLGVPAMPADTTDAMRTVTSWASRGAGPGQTAVRKALDARKAGEGQRVRQHVIDTMGPVEDPIAQVAANRARSMQEAAPLYEQAYAQPMQVTERIQQIMETPAFLDAMEPAVRNIRNSGGNPQAMGFTMNPDGSVTQSARTLSTEAFDQVIRAMQAAGRRAGEINPLTGAVRNTTDSLPINNLARDLRTELTEQNAPYAQAVNGYADDAVQRQALEAGLDVRKRTGHEINAQARALPEDAHPSFAVGARTALADEASQYGAKYPNGNTASQVRKGLGDPTKRQAIEAMDGNRGSVPALLDRLEPELQANMVYSEARGNSATAGRQAIDVDMGEDISKNLTSLTAFGASAAAVRWIGSKAKAEFRKEVQARIAQVVTETNPETVRELMAEIAQRARADREFGDLLHRSGLLAAKAYGGNIVTD